VKNIRAKEFFLWIAALFVAFFVGCSAEKESADMTDYRELDGKELVICATNASYEKEVKSILPNAKIRYITNYFDAFIMVTKGMGDATFVFNSFEKIIQLTYPSMYCLTTPIEIPIVAGFSSKAKDLREKFNDYVAMAKAEGYFDSLYDKWVTHYEEIHETIDFSDLEGSNGEFVIGTFTLNPPYEYLIENKFAGFEMEMLYDFCKRSGLKPKIENTLYDGVIAGVGTGKFDMGLGAYGYTEERAKGMLFSDPFLTDYVCLMASHKQNFRDSETFFQKFQKSFYRNFIQDSRWKILLEGLGVTFVITAFSIVPGTLLGFLLYILCRKRRRLDYAICFIYETFESLPVLVVLMVAYYVVFGSSPIGGTTVSIFVFGSLFTLATYSMLKIAVRSVPQGQTEAGLALGYTEYQTLFKIVLPQSIKFFMPVYRGNVVAYLKATAVVGYVAVEDLTKVGDIIRSQTFEAFLPLIAVALLYYIMARLIIFLLNKIGGGKR